MAGITHIEYSLLIGFLPRRPLIQLSMSRTASRPAAARAPAANAAAADPASPSDLRERLALLVHEGALDPKRWREFLEGLGRRMKGAATLLLRSPHVAEAGLLYSWGGTDEVLAQYARRYFPSDPFVNLPEKQVITLHEFVPVE